MVRPCFLRWGKVPGKFYIMPLFFQLALDDQTRLAVWHITEEESFYRTLAIPQRDVVHPHKRLQHLAGRYLLRHLFPEFPSELIRIADTRKPFLADEAFHFSISHCSDYAAAIVSRTKRVGVDIEVVTEKAVRVKGKFASAEEWAIVNERVGYPAQALSYEADKTADACVATLIWSCKEAVFKWFGNGEVDFKEHISVQTCTKTDAAVLQTGVLFQKEKPEPLLVQSRLMQGLWLSYVVG